MAEDNQHVVPTTAEDADLRAMVMALATQMAEVQALLVNDKAKFLPSFVPSTNHRLSINPSLKTDKPTVILPQNPNEKWFREPQPNLINLEEEDRDSLMRQPEVIKGQTRVVLDSVEGSDDSELAVKIQKILGKERKDDDFDSDYFKAKKMRVEREKEMNQMRSKMQLMKEEILKLKKGKIVSEEEENWNLESEITHKSSVPPKFIMPDLEKYDGTGDPEWFMHNFLNKMHPFTLEEPTILQLFPRYLSHTALEWYCQIRAWEIPSLKGLTRVLIRRFNMYSFDDPKERLKNVKQGPTEKFTDFIERWKELVSEVGEVFSEGQQIPMITGNLNDTFTAFMSMQSFRGLKELVTAGSVLDEAFTKREMGVQRMQLTNNQPNLFQVNNMGNSLPEFSSQQGVQRSISSNLQNFQNLNNFNANHQSSKAFPDDCQDLRFNGNISQYRRSNRDVDQNPQNCKGYSRGHSAQRGSGIRIMGSRDNSYSQATSLHRHNQSYRRPKRHFDDIGMPLSKMFKLLEAKNIVETLPKKEGVLSMGPLHHDFCDYHQLPGHATDFCHSLKHRVQDLIDQEIIVKPNMQESTGKDGSSLNTMGSTSYSKGEMNDSRQNFQNKGEAKPQEVSHVPRKFDSLGMTLSEAFKKLSSRSNLGHAPIKKGTSIMGRYPTLFCDYHNLAGHKTDHCSTLRNRIQDMIDQKEIPKPHEWENVMQDNGVDLMEICLTEGNPEISAECSLDRGIPLNGQIVANADGISQTQGDITNGRDSLSINLELIHGSEGWQILIIYFPRTLHSPYHFQVLLKLGKFSKPFAALTLLFAMSDAWRDCTKPRWNVWRNSSAKRNESEQKRLY